MADLDLSVVFLFGERSWVGGIMGSRLGVWGVIGVLILLLS